MRSFFSRPGSLQILETNSGGSEENEAGAMIAASARMSVPDQRECEDKSMRTLIVDCDELFSRCAGFWEAVVR